MGLMFIEFMTFFGVILALNLSAYRLAALVEVQVLADNPVPAKLCRWFDENKILYAWQ